jgi:peptide/nickel transport system permease protein
LKHRSLALGLALTAAFLLMALISLVWTPYDPTAIRIVQKLKSPDAGHWLGTDHFGRDVLSMIMVGARNSIAVGLVAVGLGMAAGVPLGLLAAGRPGGWTDEGIGRAADLVFAFPALLSAILITALRGPGAVNAVLAIGIFNIGVFARIARTAALSVRARPFVRAAFALGRGPVAVTLVHVLPNMAGTLIVQGTISFAVAILAEASLSYLGLGIQPPAPSWGRMLSEAQTFLHLAPTLAIFPGAAIALAVLGLNLLGDGLRDLIDPRLRRRL